MRTLPTLLALAVTCTLCAQHKLLTDYDWDPKPGVPDTSVLKGRSQMILQRTIIGHYEEQGDGLNYYELFHLKSLVGDQSAVEGNSTMEIGTRHVSKVLRISARSVAPDGTVHVLSEDAFKRSTDERNGGSTLYFAFEGLQPGSVVEYILLTRQRGEIQGELTRMQFNVPTLSSSYDLLVPDEWRFVFKGYNGLPLPVADSSLEGLIRHHLELHDVPALEEERSAMPRIHRMYLVAKLDGVPARGVRDYSGYTGATRTYHTALYPELEKGTRKALASTVGKMQLSYARDEADRIRTLDRYIRSHFRMAESGSGALDDLDQVLRTGNCNELGLQKLYANLLREAGIEHQVVVTCDRSETPFDRDFQAHNYLRTVAFHFPKIDQYLDPTQVGLGLGYLASDNMGTHALFIRNMEVNGVYTGLGSVKYIPELPAEATHNDLRIALTLSPDASQSTITLENDLTGYNAAFVQNFWPYLDEEQRNKIIDEQFNHLTEGAGAHQITVENGAHEHFGVKPLSYKGTLTTPHLNNRAGEDVLLRVGELIGPQMEMYAEKERKLPVDEAYNRYYDRRITITLPQGWTCPDISSLNIQKTLTVDGKVQAEFRSSAVQQGDTITVVAVEYYLATHVALDHFEEYRAVINASADFNKRALLLHAVK